MDLQESVVVRLITRWADTQSLDDVIINRTKQYTWVDVTLPDLQRLARRAKRQRNRPARFSLLALKRGMKAIGFDPR